MTTRRVPEVLLLTLCDVDRTVSGGLTVHVVDERFVPSFPAEVPITLLVRLAHGDGRPHRLAVTTVEQMASNVSTLIDETQIVRPDRPLTLSWDFLYRYTARASRLFTVQWDEEVLGVLALRVRLHRARFD